MRDWLISPLEGEMSGRTEGGEHRQRVRFLPGYFRVAGRSSMPRERNAIVGGWAGGGRDFRNSASSAWSAHTVASSAAMRVSSESASDMLAFVNEV